MISRSGLLVVAMELWIVCGSLFDCCVTFGLAFFNLENVFSRSVSALRLLFLLCTHLSYSVVEFCLVPVLPGFANGEDVGGVCKEPSLVMLTMECFEVGRSPTSPLLNRHSPLRISAVSMCTKGGAADARERRDVFTEVFAGGPLADSAILSSSLSLSETSQAVSWPWAPRSS